MQKFLRNIDELQKIINELGDKNLFLVTGANSFIKSGASKLIEPLLVGCNVTHFSNVAPNPTLKDVEHAVDMYRQNNCSNILAVGGGSVIDVAKATFLLSAQDEPLENVIRFNKVIKAPVGSLIAVPTTAGSGAESTHFAVIYINNQKYSLSHNQALPNIVVLDPRFTYSLTPSVTATSGIDAVAQAIEAYWSIQSTDLSRRYSSQALLKLVPNIETAVLRPNPKVRQSMLEGANLAGQAINIAKTTACHAMSYGFTSYFGVPHGQAVAYSLPAFITFNAAITAQDCQDPRGIDFVYARMDELYKLLDAEDANSAKRRIENLINSIGLHRQFSPSEKTSVTDTIIKSIDPDRLSNNPRKVMSKDVYSIISAIVRT